MLQRTSLLIVCLLWCFQSSASADEDILKKSMDSRRLMRNAELGLKIDYHDVQGGNFTRRCTVYFDGEICRVDTQRNNGDGTDDFRVVDVMNGENRIWYTTMTSGPGSRVTSWVKDLTESAERESSILPHPWYLGLAACEWERLIHFQPELCITGRGNAGDETEVSSGDYKEMNSWIVSRTGKSSGGSYVTRGWIVPKLGNSVVKVETVSDFDQFHQVDTSVTEHQVVDGVYVPQHVHFTSTMNGVLQREEHVEVTVRKLNSQIDRSTFELGGLGIDVGAPFSVFPDSKGGAYLWDGEKLVVDRRPMAGGPIDRTSRLDDAGVQATSTIWKWILFANAVIFGAIAIFTLVRFVKH